MCLYGRTHNNLIDLLPSAQTKTKYDGLSNKREGFGVYFFGEKFDLVHGDDVRRLDGQLAASRLKQKLKCIIILAVGKLNTKHLWPRVLILFFW